MKKLTAMLLSLVMCLSLLTIPAQAESDPEPPVDPGIIKVEEPNGPAEPGDKDPEDPGEKNPDRRFPGERGEVPIDN